MNRKIKVGIMGATGYSGAVLLRLLLSHPEVQIEALFSSTRSGTSLASLDPGLLPWASLLPCLIPEDESPELDCLFTATPNGVATGIASHWLAKGTTLIDLAADFRIRSGETYQEWYHPLKAPPADLISRAVYGLVELNRPLIRETRLVANPGCYPTAAALGIVPLFKAGMVEPDLCIIDAKSGTTGAGKKAEERLLHAEVGESFGAYGVFGHRHIPEIEQSLKLFAGHEILVRFTPHLLPIKRGLQTTSYLRLKAGFKPKEAIQLLREVYDSESFVHYSEQIPSTKDVVYTNHGLLHLAYDQRTNLLTVIAVIDNLMKGAAGQAVQNFNLVFDLPETLGLSA